MNNIYLVPNDDGTYEAFASPVTPTENAALLVAEGEYPVECYYYRKDMNGDSILESSEYTNQNTLIWGLNSHGLAFHTIRSLWDFDSCNGVSAEIVNIYDAACRKVDEIIELQAEEIDLYFALKGVVLGEPSGEFLNRAKSTIMKYVREYGFRVEYKDTFDVMCVEGERPNNRIVADGIEELISKVRLWNYDLLVAEEDEEGRKKIMEDTVVLDELEEMLSNRTGYPLGNLTVKELIAVLSKMPEDYRVTCCGAENYLYLFTKDKYITIDNESWLCC
jgi:hypothetical protein